MQSCTNARSWTSSFSQDKLPLNFRVDILCSEEAHLEVLFWFPCLLPPTCGFLPVLACQAVAQPHHMEPHLLGQPCRWCLVVPGCLLCLGFAVLGHLGNWGSKGFQHCLSVFWQWGWSFPDGLSAQVVSKLMSQLGVPGVLPSPGPVLPPSSDAPQKAARTLP